MAVLYVEYSPYTFQSGLHLIVECRCRVSHLPMAVHEMRTSYGNFNIHAPINETEAVFKYLKMGQLSV